MNTSRILPSPSVRQRSRSALAALAWTAIGALPSPAQGAEEPAAKTAVEPMARPYVVFAGLDLFVDDKGNRLPVVGGSESEVVVWDERKDAVETLHNVALSAAVEPKLARARVTVDALAGQPVYSPGNDPDAAAQAQQFFLLNLENARAEEAESNMRMAVAAADSFGAMASAGGGSGTAYEARMNEAREQAGAAVEKAASTYANPIYRDSRIGSPEIGENHDGFAVTFTVSSREPVENVYGALRLQARIGGDPQAPPLHALKLFSVPKLGAKPRKVVVRQYGIPPEYTVESYQIHFYAGGRELATNSSSHRVDVTEEEAHQFMILRHAQSHPGATLPAQVVPELQRDAPPSLVDRGLDGVLVDFEVSADGTIANVGGPGTTSGEITTENIETLRQVRLLPALVKGQPVAGRGTFALGELFLWPKP